MSDDQEPKRWQENDRRFRFRALMADLASSGRIPKASLGSDSRPRECLTTPNKLVSHGFLLGSRDLGISLALRTKHAIQHTAPMSTPLSENFNGPSAGKCQRVA